MTTVGQQIALQANSNVNQNVFGSILYNVKAYGAKGDGITDDTTKVQATIDYAISVGGKAIFYPNGKYNVTALTNADQVVFFGDNASFVGIPNVIYQIGDPNIPIVSKYSKDRTFVYSNKPNQLNPFFIIGDSITESAKTYNFPQDTYAGIITRAIQKNSGVRNYGFVNFRDVSSDMTSYQKTTRSGFNVNPSPFFDPNVFGGAKISSITSGDYLEAVFTGKICQLVYVRRDDGGILQVSLDGTNVSTIDTTLNPSGYGDNAAFSANISAFNWGTHTIRFTKLDSKPTDLCGNIYKETTDYTPIVYNVGRTTITASEIPNSVYDIYASSGMAILALGVNDQLFVKDVAGFKAKIKYFYDKIVAVKGSLIVCDFMFGSPDSSLYKKALHDLSTIYPQFVFLDFAKIFFQDSTQNINANLVDTDNLHPTVAGHELIANTLLKYMGLPFTKGSLQIDTWHDATLLNGWLNFDVNTYNKAQYLKDSNGFVHLRGLIKSGTVTASTVLFNLPVGYRNDIRDMLTSISDTVIAQIDVTSDGAVRIMRGTNGFISLDGLQFKAQ